MTGSQGLSHAATSRPTISEDQVRSQLKKILASPGFFRAGRMQRFLTFVVDSRLSGAGNSEDLKESIIGAAVFDRAIAYDPKSDPVVRVEARRLRAKLEEYYQDLGKADPIFIEIPKGSYVPRWELRATLSILPAPIAPAKAGFRKPVAVLVGIVIVAILAIILSRSWRSFFADNTGGAANVKIRSLAVLPFRNLSGNAKQDYLVSGLTDEITTQLAKVNNLTVISRRSTEFYRASAKRLPQIAHELQVDAVIEGTVDCSGNRIRVSAQLIKASTDSHLWAETYQRDLSDLFSLQAEIAEDIAERIGVVLNPVKAATVPSNPASQEAYGLYLKGRYFWNKRTLAGLEKSIEYYQRSIRLDPNYAATYAALSESYVILSSYGGAAPVESMVRARAAAEEALRRDSSLSSSHTALAAVKAGLDLDSAGATKEFKRALQLEPSNPTAHHWYALHLSRLGRHADAALQIQRALELDPLSLIINTDAGEVFYAARKPDQAFHHLHRALELDPNFAEAHLVLGKVYAEKRELKKAIAEFDLANRLFGDAPNVWALKGHVLALSKRRAEAYAIADKLKQAASRRYVSGVDIAMVYCGLADRDAAMTWLEKAYDVKGKGLNIIGSDPLFDGCRSDARFQDLLRRLRLTR